MTTLGDAYTRHVRAKQANAYTAAVLWVMRDKLRIDSEPASAPEPDEWEDPDDVAEPRGWGRYSAADLAQGDEAYDLEGDR